MIDLSIIIVNYNTYDLTLRCIESVHNFTHGVNFEIILVDNASTECNAVVFKEKFPSIILVKNNENVGFARGNNIGISNASAESILLLNSDTQVIDNSICTSFKLLKEMKERGVAVVTGKLIYPNGQVQYQCGRFPSIKLLLFEIFRLQKLLSKTKAGELMLGGFFDHQRPVYPDWIWGTFFMFSKDILRVFPDGKLSETYFMYQEDLEWCYYIRKAGFKIYYDPKISLIHIFSGSSVSQAQNELKSARLKKNFDDFLDRHYGLIYFKVYKFLQKVNQTLQR